MEVRCKGRKTAKACLKPPVACAWSDATKTCDKPQISEPVSVVAKERCKGRKTVKSCLKPPVSCAWRDSVKKCDNLKAVLVNKHKQEAKDKAVSVAKKTVRCAARRSIKTCTKNTHECEWQNDKCVQRVQAPIVDANVIQADLAKATITSADRAVALEKMRKIRAYYSMPMNDRIGYAHRVRKAMKNANFERIQRIGSDSAYGETYLVKNTDIPLKPLYVALKVMPNKGKMAIEREIYLYYRFSRYVSKAINPHFPMVYSHNICPKCTYVNKNILATRPPKSCYHVFNELANGDLKMWMKSQVDSGWWHDEATYRSMVAQTLLGLYTLHWDAVMTHDDLHWGNLLYHDVSATIGGYWHYRVDGLDIYVRNMGQLWILWDFGLMSIGYSRASDAYRLMHFTHWTENTYGAKIPGYAKLLTNPNRFLMNKAPSRRSDLAHILALADGKTVIVGARPAGAKILNAGYPYSVVGMRN